MAFFNSAMFGKDDETEKKMREHLGKEMRKQIDKELMNAIANPLTNQKTTVADDGNTLTYDDILKAQKSLRTGYGKEPKKPVYNIDKRKYPVLHTFMSIPSVSNHIIVEISQELSKDDPYGKSVKANIKYKIPKEEELEYKNGLCEFIMNYISNKELNEYEISIFEHIVNDMTVKSKTLDDLKNIINKI